VTLRRADALSSAPTIPGCGGLGGGDAQPVGKKTEDTFYLGRPPPNSEKRPEGRLARRDACSRRNDELDAPKRRLGREAHTPGRTRTLVGSSAAKSSGPRQDGRSNRRLATEALPKLPLRSTPWSIAWVRTRSPTARPVRPALTSIRSRSFGRE